MMKKQNEVASEDIEIKKVAYFKNSQQVLLLIILIVLFTLTFFCSLFYIGKYYDAKLGVNDVNKLIEITTKDNNILITNNGFIDKTITEEDTKYNKEVLVEKDSVVKFTTKKTAKNDSVTNFDVRYNIKNNDFENKVIASTNNEVLVRFKYSYDNKNWQYINNVISTSDSTLKPLMGNYYDITGLVTNLKVATNFEMKNKVGKTTTIYWKCETLLKNIRDNVGKNITAEFKIDYKDE